MRRILSMALAVALAVPGFAQSKPSATPDEVKRAVAGAVQIKKTVEKVGRMDDLSFDHAYVSEGTVCYDYRVRNRSGGFTKGAAVFFKNVANTDRLVYSYLDDEGRCFWVKGDGTPGHYLAAGADVTEAVNAAIGVKHSKGITLHRTSVREKAVNGPVHRTLNWHRDAALG